MPNEYLSMPTLNDSTTLTTGMIACLDLYLNREEVSSIARAGWEDQDR